MTSSLYKFILKAKVATVGTGSGGGGAAPALAITGVPVTTGQVGQAYAGFTATASGGVTPYVYSVASGALPAGVTLDSSTGVVSGTPTTATTYSSIVIRATDHNGNTADLPAFSVTVQAAGPPIPIVADQTIDFGALTLAAAGGVAPTNTGGVITSASITGGTLSAGWSISAAGVLTKNSANPAAGTLVCTFGNGFGNQTGVTITINAIANAYSVLSMAEAKAAVVAIGTASSGARTIYCRTATYAEDVAFLKNRAFANTVTITKHSGATPTFSQIDVNNAPKVVLDGLTFYRTAAGTELLARLGSNPFTVQNCTFSGPTINPTGDYSVTIPTIINGIVISNTAANVSILNNTLHDLYQCIGGSCFGAFRVEGNYLYSSYTDFMNFSYISTMTSLNISDNVMIGGIGSSSDPGNPHVDTCQLQNTTVDTWGNITFYRNIMIHRYLRCGEQGLFCHATGGGYYSIAAKGNVFANTGTGSGRLGIWIQQADTCQAYGNTIFRTDVPSHDGSSGGPGIVIGSVTTKGTHTSKNNAADTISLSGTVSQANDVALGVGGATVAYTAAFDGPTFAPTTRAEVLALLSMKAAGPLDLAVNVGAVGSGYVNWPTTSPGNDGSFNGGFE